MSQTLVDQITLDCLMNKETMGTLVAKQLEKQVKQEQFQAYKERVVTLFHQLVNQEVPHDLTPDVKYAYHSFVKSAIGLFASADDPSDDTDCTDEIDDIADDCDSNVSEEYDSLDDYDEDATRSVKMDLYTLDSFVTRTPYHKHRDPFAVKKSV